MKKRQSNVVHFPSMQVYAAGTNKNLVQGSMPPQTTVLDSPLKKITREKMKQRAKLEEILNFARAERNKVDVLIDIRDNLHSTTNNRGDNQ